MTSVNKVRSNVVTAKQRKCPTLVIIRQSSGHPCNRAEASSIDLLRMHQYPSEYP